MLFKPCYKKALLSAFIVTAPAFSADLAIIKSQAQSVSNQLSQIYQANSTIDDFRINEISHQYLYNHGLVFTIETNINDLITNPQTQDKYNQQQGSHDSHSDNHLPNTQSNDELTELRFTARNLAHQEFSLQKQIQSMQTKSLQSDELTKSAIDKKIRVNQDKMNQLIKEKAAVSQQITNQKLNNTMSNSSESPLSRAQLYKTMLKQTYQLLCDDQKLHHKLLDNEQLSVIFKDLGEEDGSGFQDNVVSIDKTTMMQCNNGEITQQQAVNASKKYQY
ncbi:MAG: hypothetical protein MJK12_12675 [Colwellia sp.]|nr:hypothetical protein [Colwellia sp.]